MLEEIVGSCEAGGGGVWGRGGGSGLSNLALCFIRWHAGEDHKGGDVNEDE